MRYLKNESRGILLRYIPALMLLLCLGQAIQAREYHRYFVNDPFGNPIMVLDEDGSVLARYVYTPYGYQVPTQTMAQQRIGFASGIRETSRLHYIKHRYYNPQLGRFYQPDPVGFLPGGIPQINRYAYGRGDPYSYRDPSGRQSVGEQLEDAALRNIAQGNSVNGYLLTTGVVGWNLLGAESLSRIYDRRGDVGAGTYAVGTLEALPVLGTLKYLNVAGGAANTVKPFALGLSEHLDDFAKMRRADTWKSLPDPAKWKSGILSVLANPTRQVHFNLDGIDVWKGVQRAASGRGGATDWELLQIKQNPQFWDSLQFWKGGERVPNPFK